MPVTVGGDYADVGGVAWDSEYNTCYFLGDAGSLTINPMGEDVTVSAANVSGGELGQWQAAEKTADGFNVPIGQGNNVVKITTGGVTDYRVIRGARLTPVIEGPNADGKIYPGDEVTLSFEGLFQPAPKFAGMYNPGFGNSMKVNYRLGEENIASGGTQYGLIDKNGHKITFTVPQNAEGALTLSDGKITGTVMGDSYGKHRTITDVGVPANFNASGLPLEELPLPDVTVTVTRPATDEAKTQAKEAINTAFAKYNKDKYTSSNWEKLVAAKDKGLADIDAAADLSAVTAAKNETLLAMSSIPQKGSGGSGDKPDAGGIDKTHTKSYYKTTGLDFDIGSNAEGTVTISFSDYGERLHDADFETPLGVIIAPTEVPYKKGDTIADVTVRLLKALGIGHSNTGTVDSGFYLSSIKDFYLSDGYKVKSFGEFDAGAASGWMISQNNWFINRSAADYKVEDGDLIKWQYTCQLGADIGCDMSKPSAKITGLNFKKDYGTLSPKFSKSEKNYTYTVSSSVKSICLEAEQENYWAVLTYTADGEKYKPMEPIPVEDGTVIKLDCAFAEFAGDKPSDTDSITITVKVKGSTSTPGGQTKPSDSKTPDTEPQGESPVIKPEAKLDETGEAKAAVEQKDVTGAVSKAKTNKAAGIVIWPQGAEDAKKVSVSLPAASAKAVSDAGLSLCVKTGIASITLPNEAAKAAAEQAKDTVTISAEQKGEGVLLSVSADGEAILEMPGGIAASIATQKTGEGLTAVLVGEDGSETVLKKSVVENGEIYMLLPGSATVKIVDNTKTFDDVDADFWGAKAICFTAARGLFEGTSERTFGPGEPMSRGMLVTVLHRLEGSPAPQQSAGFTDVADGAWYYDAVCWANENNIVNGISGTEFAPDQALTRQTLATILYRYAKTIGLATGEKDSLESFADGADTADWAKEAMGWAVSAGLINGRDGGILDPAPAPPVRKCLQFCSA